MGSFSTAVLFERLLRMEKKLAELRRVLLKKRGPELATRNPGSLRGIWQGVTIDEEDFAETRASLKARTVLP